MSENLASQQWKKSPIWRQSTLEISPYYLTESYSMGDRKAKMSTRWSERQYAHPGDHNKILVIIKTETISIVDFSIEQNIRGLNSQVSLRSGFSAQGVRLHLFKSNTSGLRAGCTKDNFGPNAMIGLLKNLPRIDFCVLQTYFKAVHIKSKSIFSRQN